MARSLRRQTPSAILPVFAVALLVYPAMAVAQPDPDFIAEITAPLPEHLRADATVRVRESAGSVQLIRQGTNGLTCIRSAQPPRVGVTCLDDSALPYIAGFGRLRSEAPSPTAAASRITAALDDGTIPAPPAGARAYMLFGPDRANAKLTTGVFLPDATAASTGLPTERSDSTWLMCPGTKRAHIMMGDIPYGQDEAYWKMCGQVSLRSQTMPLTVGSRLGHYNVTALIGEGGMGQVYQATGTQLGIVAFVPTEANS